MRLRNIDILRGIVMVLMCIDHARDYTIYHPADPMVLESTPFIVYIFRFFAHFCAPAFILLAGISAKLSGRKKTKKELSKYLLTRGLILCLLELTLVNWAWSFNPTYKMIYLQVIWAIGISMIALSALIYLKDRYIFMISTLVIVGHNLFDKVSFHEGTFMYYIWSFLLQKNVLPVTEFLSVRTTYPFLPVIAVMGLGYVIARFYTEKSRDYRKKIFLISGISLLVIFFLLRLVVGYGDPFGWQIYDNHFFTVMSVFNVTKYPFSLQFLLMTFGVCFIYLSLTDGKMQSSKVSLFESIGSTPMFFYILHIYVLHTLALIAMVFDGVSLNFNRYLGGIPYNLGVPMWYMWLMVAVTVVGLYVLCKKYLKLKQSKKYKWTSYI